MPQLMNIHSIEATLELVTGLRIGAGDSEMHIGGVDNTVVKHPITQTPYIPGSSIKGKMRSLLEWKSGAVQSEALDWDAYAENTNPTQKAAIKTILQLFGISGDAKLGVEQMGTLGPSRLAFWDCNLDPTWEKMVRDNNQMLTEVKSENRINRISGVAEHPRNTERVPSGARFDFRLSFKKLAGDQDNLLTATLQGLKLIELDSLGGAGSRGYGKVKFTHIRIDGKVHGDGTLDHIKPFEQ